MEPKTKWPKQRQNLQLQSFNKLPPRLTAGETLYRPKLSTKMSGYTGHFFHLKDDGENG